MESLSSIFVHLLINTGHLCPLSSTIRDAIDFFPTLSRVVDIFWNSSCSWRNCTLLARRQLIDVADLLAKEPKDFDFHLIQACYQVSDLTVNHHADALN